MLQGWWKVPAILSCSSTCIHTIGQQILQKLLTGEEIVDESVVVFSMQFSCECLHHSPQDHALLVAFLPSVNLELLEIAIVAISKYPHLYPTLDRFQGITPFET